MVAKLLNGKEVAGQLLQDLQLQIQGSNLKRAPCLATILVGEDEASKVYLANKRQASERLGITCQQYHLVAQTGEKELITLLEELNQTDTVDGILVQLPLPEHLSTRRVLTSIDPRKDVDGFHPFNVGNLFLNLPGLYACTPLGVMTLLNRTGETLEGKVGLVIGASNIVGKPMSLLLVNQQVTTIVAQKSTQDLASLVKQADIVISATGVPHLIRGAWIKEGAVVIDVGIHRLAGGRLVGDVVFEEALEVAGWLTPVPGGVGPMTVAILMQNTWQAAVKLKYCLK